MPILACTGHHVVIVRCISDTQKVSEIRSVSVVRCTAGRDLTQLDAC
jgi:hypothetical protein